MVTARAGSAGRVIAWETLTMSRKEAPRAGPA